MKWLFADTAGWVAAADGSDLHHQKARDARDLWLREGGKIITTDYIVDETLTMLRMKLNTGAAEKWWKQVSGSPRVRIERIDALRSEKARAIFFNYKDKSFSFTDCTSFAVMKELKVTRAWTVDHHFLQMGFTLIPAV